MGQPGWQQQLENNKQTFVSEFVQRSRFSTALPTTLTPQQFVDLLNTNAGHVLSAAERTTVINLFGGSGNTTNLTARAQALRVVAEDQDLDRTEFNRAFVFMQYYGYLRRNPNDPQDTDYTGYDFWLTKLNQFNGNFVDAQIVKAFIESSEYRWRFGGAPGAINKARCPSLHVLCAFSMTLGLCGKKRLCFWTTDLTTETPRHRGSTEKRISSPPPNDEVMAETRKKIGSKPADFGHRFSSIFGIKNSTHSWRRFVVAKDVHCNWNCAGNARQEKSPANGLASLSRKLVSE